MKNFLFTIFFSLVSFSTVFSAAPEIKCDWLPGCKWTGGEDHTATEFISHLIGLLIQYVAVIAVIALMISGIMYLISGW